MQPKIRVMTFTLVITDTEEEASLDRGLPYEKFLFGHKNASASVELKALNLLSSDTTNVARIEPIHIHAARDHLVLTNPSILKITTEESDELFEAVKDIFSEMADKFYRPKANRWFIETPALASLSTVSVEQAQGRNIDHWMPSDTDTAGLARQWRKWQNEIQMIWFNHPVNLARQSRELLAINSVWISGIGSINDIKPHSALLAAKKIHSVDSCLSVVAKHLNKDHLLDIHQAELSDILSLVSIKDQNSQSIWEYACKQLINKKINGIQLIDFPEGQERSRLISLNQLPKAGFAFWKKPSTPPLADMLSP
jgi:hypothetical protein